MNANGREKQEETNFYTKNRGFNTKSTKISLISPKIRNRLIFVLSFFR
jgi:hypothetical protein